ncbi:MAG: AI-2E family transporter [Lachnospiraceae bacterium]|nr:AI-2E family transporter [Lachnospiraceae bacterium]
MMDRKRKFLTFLSVLTGVYISLKFLLPLVLPFLMAYWISLLLKPQIKKLNRISHLPTSACAFAVLLFWLAAIMLGLWLVGGILLSQISNFINFAPSLIEKICKIISDICCRLDSVCGIEDGTIYYWLDSRYELIAAKAQESSMNYFLGNSIPVISCIFNGIAVLIIIIIATVLCSSSWERIRRWRNTSAFRQEIDRISSRLLSVAISFLGTQLTILVFTSIISTLGLMILGSRYSVLFGIGIGFVDLLPIFGTGTVFIPWIIYLCFAGSYYRAAIVMTIYIICYFMREFLEAKLIGNGIGIGSLETLVSIYIGFRLFGIAGAILGPVGFIIIKELMDMYCGGKNNNANVQDAAYWR